MLLIVPETSLMLAPGTDRVSLVTTFDNDLSVSRGIKPADAQSFISVDYLWAGMSIAIMRACTHNRNFRSHSSQKR